MCPPRDSWINLRPLATKEILSATPLALGMTFALYSPTMRHEPVHKGEPQGLYAVRSARRLACQVPGARTEEPLPKTLTFKDEGKIRELARRGEAWQTSEDRQVLTTRLRRERAAFTCGYRLSSTAD